MPPSSAPTSRPWRISCGALGYRTALSGKMHFCGPDQLHGFEERLTTDIYPADFGWTPNWDQPDERPSWYHNMSSVDRGRASACAPTSSTYDEEVVFAAERAIYDHVRGNDGRPFCLVRLADPSARSLRDPGATTGTSIGDERHPDAAGRGSPATALDPHSLRLRHVCDMDRVEFTEAARPRAPAVPISARSPMSTPMSAGCCARWRRPGSTTTPSSSSPAITARCWASAAPGTR